MGTSFAKWYLVPCDIVVIGGRSRRSRKTVGGVSSASIFEVTPTVRSFINARNEVPPSMRQGKISEPMSVVEDDRNHRVCLPVPRADSA